MAQKYGFFNSVNNDRVYDAADVARFLSKFFTNGIFNNSLAVSANDNMTVSVATGQANINGYGYENTEILALDIDEADSELNRIDSVIVRLDLTNRQITAMVLQGQYATTPSQPSIIRNGNVYDLRLANILVSAGVTRITTDDITDTRFSSDCGNVTQAVLELSTDEIFNQYETWFTNWFQNLQDQLDDNQAGHLQNEIDEINNNIDSISQTVNENYEEQQEIKERIDEITTYSSDEKIIGTSTNGKPLYRKVISGNLGSTNVPHGISNAIFKEPHGSYTSGNNTFPIPSVRPNYPEYNIGCYVSPTEIFFDKGTGLGQSNTFEITLEYTKTTD